MKNFVCKGDASWGGLTLGDGGGAMLALLAVRGLLGRCFLCGAVKSLIKMAEMVKGEISVWVRGNGVCIGKMSDKIRGG